jgi:hypothetical protein
VFAAAILGMGIVPAGTAFSQFDDTPVELQETNYFGMGARAMGMGGSYVAVSEDVAAMFYNPAGLVQVRRPELAGGLSVDTRDTRFLPIGEGWPWGSPSAVMRTWISSSSRRDS